MIETDEQRQERLANNARIEAQRQATAEFRQWLENVYFEEHRFERYAVSDREISLMRHAWDAGREFNG